MEGDTDQLAHGKYFYLDMSRIHLIYAGDHGQGTLRSALKLIFIKVDDEDS